MRGFSNEKTLSSRVYVSTDEIRYSCFNAIGLIPRVIHADRLALKVVETRNFRGEVRASGVESSRVGRYKQEKFRFIKICWGFQGIYSSVDLWCRKIFLG